LANQANNHRFTGLLSFASKLWTCGGSTHCFSYTIVYLTGPSKDTESNIRGRIKGMFNIYCGQRLQGKFNTDLLRNILYRFRLYGVVVPQFLTVIACFKGLEDAVAALPKATKYGQ
jgi:hypothetical protein